MLTYRRNNCIIVFCQAELLDKYAPLAQLVEHLTLNQGVLGSSPRWCTKAFKFLKAFLYACLAPCIVYSTMFQQLTLKILAMCIRYKP